MATLLPSTKPCSFRPWLKAATKCEEAGNVVLRRKPTTGIACCARAVKGHKAAPPTSVTKSLRLIQSPRRAAEQRQRHVEAQSFGGLHIDDRRHGRWVIG